MNVDLPFMILCIFLNTSMFQVILLKIVIKYVGFSQKKYLLTFNYQFLFIYPRCLSYSFITPHPLRAVGVLFSPMVSRWSVGWGGRQWEKVCLAVSQKP